MSMDRVAGVVGSTYKCSVASRWCFWLWLRGASYRCPRTTLVLLRRRRAGRLTLLRRELALGEYKLAVP